MKFRSSLKTEDTVENKIFNGVSIYVPKSLAANNLASGSYDASSITAEKYGVIEVTVDNYEDVLAGSLLTQWSRVFNDGANSAIVLYIVIFDDTGFAPVTTASSIAWQPLTKAFKELYFISFFKTMFDTDYTSITDGDTPAVNNYADLLLCLASLCESEEELSVCLAELKVKAFTDGDTDPNVCKIMSEDRTTEITNASTFSGTDNEARLKNLWGFLHLIAADHTWLIIHSGDFMLPIVLGKWFEEANSSGEYVGNKLAKIRLSGDGVRPSGLPSPLNSEVFLNLEEGIYTILDSKNVGYFISISDSTLNNVELVRDKTISGMPVTAYAIARWVDYTTAQDVAEYATANETLTKPVLVVQKTYENIQAMLIQNLQVFAGLGRISNIVLDFPAFAEVKKGQSIEGSGVWSAVYVDDLESVDITGSISF